MKYLIFADVHGNLPALENVIKKEKDVDGYVNIGDVVNYGPWSNECVDLISNLHNCTSILGNHEEYFINKKCNIKNNIVQSFFNHNINDFNRYDEIRSYLKDYQIGNLYFTHTVDDHTYIYNDTKIEIDKNIILAHSHQQYFRHINNFLLLNPGSVGQNRKFINVSNYIIWDTESCEFELKYLCFSVDLLINEMKSKNFPEICLNYYKSKKIFL